MNVSQFKQALVENDLTTIQQQLPLDPTLIDTINDDGEALVFFAAKKSALPVLQYLVEYGLRVNLNAVDSQGRDLLHYAAMSGNVDKCRYLVERGGMDVLRGDHKLHSPFDIAHKMKHADLESYFSSVIGVSWDQLYHNPIRRGFFPDPSIIRVEKDYYMVNSSFIYFPCIPISHSKDLIHWEIIGHAITNPEWSCLDELEGGRGYWAPDISYSNGLYYICATLRLNDQGYIRRRQMIVTSKKPEGPYSKPVFIDEDGIDPSLFHDDDGKHYMLLNRGARIFEISADGRHQLSKPMLLYYGSQKRAPEGPHLLKHNGWYYLFEAEGGTGFGHRETVSRSRTLLGVYTPSPYNPVIRQTDERSPLQRCGHAKPVSTYDGRWFFVYLCGRTLDGKWSVLGRETSLDPFTWTADGWPLLNSGKGCSTQNIMPHVQSLPKEKTDWLSPRNPETEQFQWNNSILTIHGSHVPLNHRCCKSILLQRQTSFHFEFSCVVHIPEQGESGIICYYDENSFLAFGIDKHALYLSKQIGTDNQREKLLSISSGCKSIRLTVETNGLTRHFKMNQKHVYTIENAYFLSDEGVAIGKRFTGTMVGVYNVEGKGSFSEMVYSDTSDPN